MGARRASPFAYTCAVTSVPKRDRLGNHRRADWRRALERALLWSALLAGLSGCSRFDLLNATISSRGYVRSAGIAYGPLPRQKLDVYRPRHAKSHSDVVIFFYGGDWQTGSRTDYRFVAEALTSRGFIAVIADYRLYPSVTFPAFVEDGALAVRWVHDHAECLDGDADHLYLMGHSAGAHIAALLTLDAHYLHDVGLEQDAIRATAALSGPYDFAPPPGDRAVFAMKDGQTRPSTAAQPITFVDGHAPPLLLVHGLADKTVEPGNASRLGERIRSAGGAVRTVFYPKKGHVAVVLSLARPFRSLAPTLRDVTAFFHQVDRANAVDPAPPTKPTQ
ncbi:MAG: alpha/beta hydrolase [Tepidisphaeraceae bacterium]